MFSRGWSILLLLVAVLLGPAVAPVSAALTADADDAGCCVMSANHGSTAPASPDVPCDDDAAPVAEEILDADATIACDNVAFRIDLRLSGYHGSDDLLYEAPHGEPAVPPVL